MNKCKVCGIECKDQYCSPKHRMQWNRANKRTESGEQTKRTANEANTNPPSEQPIDSQVVDLPVRDNVGDAVLDMVAYGTGQCVIPDKPQPEHILTKHDLANWRGSPAYYLGQDTGLSHLTCEQLHHTLGGLKDWQGTKYYAERVYRLVHGLTSLAIPANMIADGYKAAG